jgi:hypothetical protein
MYSPIAIIASTEDRREITEKNRALLMNQGIYSEVLYPSLSTLGAKWQALVLVARHLDPSHLIITGSDDILHKDFHKLVGTADFVGLQQWYIYDPVKVVLYHFEYKAKQCLGGGRIYSRALLDACDWKLFDVTKDKWLDDLGWMTAISLTEPKIIHKPLILAVKGPWKTMNPLKETLRHKNARLMKMWKGSEAMRIIKEEFNYE